VGLDPSGSGNGVDPHRFAGIVSDRNQVRIEAVQISDQIWRPASRRREITNDREVGRVVLDEVWDFDHEAPAKNYRMVCFLLSDCVRMTIT
jgi:hypothetical protein